MDDGRYDALSRRSLILHGNKHVLPVAVWLTEHQLSLVKTPEITRGLDGRRQSGEVLSVLERLRDLEALRELPHVGVPHPRSFEIVRDHPYWDLVRATAKIVDFNLGDAPAQRLMRR